MTYNPFDVVYGELNNEPITLRPIRFDSSDYDKEYRKPDGQYIKPTMATTTCPQCGSCIEEDIPLDYNILNPIKVKCVKCSPLTDIVLKFPFKDPIKARILNPMDINPDAFNELGILMSANQKPDSEITKPCPNINYGLSSFMNSRHSWKSNKAQSIIEKEVDIFDLLGGSVPECNVSENIDNIGDDN